MIIFDEYGQPDYEAMILERQEAYELMGDCDGDCKNCFANEYCPGAEFMDQITLEDEENAPE